MIKISICYPTYNRGEIIYQSVRHILNYKCDEIEVIVLDNCSPDNTKELLSSIDDSRFRYYRNTHNIGSANLIEVMKLAKGKYAFLISDEDIVNYRGLDKLLKLVDKDEFVLLFGEVIIKNKKYTNLKSGIYNTKFDSVNCIYGRGYLSGILYNTKILNKVVKNLSVSDIQKKFGAGYNFLTIAMRMVKYGNIIVINDVVCIHKFEGKRDITTYYYNGRKGGMTYSYKLRCEQCQRHADAIVSLKMEKRELWLIYEKCVMDFCKAGTLGYLSYLNSGEIHTKIYKEGDDNDELRYIKNWIYVYRNAWRYMFDKGTISIIDWIKYAIIYSISKECFENFKIMLMVFCECKKLAKVIKENK